VDTRRQDIRGSAFTGYFEVPGERIFEPAFPEKDSIFFVSLFHRCPTGTEIARVFERGRRPE